MKVSVIINTYNRGHLLELALASYLLQSSRDFEIVVADDGSTDATPDIVEAFGAAAPFDVRYVRQAHEGHRRAAVLNLGLTAACGDWILFSDCDSLAFPDLVELHIRHARSNRLLCGGYFRLDRDETEKLNRSQIDSGEYLALFTLKHKIQVLRKSAKARWEIIRRKPRRPHNMGLNYSAPREALDRINGYDEMFTGWGAADGDVRERLRRIGVAPFSLYRTALVMHMWHPVEETKVKEITKRNHAYAVRKDIPVYCRRGLRKPESEVAE